MHAGSVVIIGAHILQLERERDRGDRRRQIYRVGESEGRQGQGWGTKIELTL